MSSKHLILLGTHDFDIYSVIFDSSANTLELVDTTRVKEHPSWLTQHPTHHEIVYANSWIEGKVFVLRVKDEGGFETLQEATSGGQGPTHLAVAEDGKALLIAHYGRSGGHMASRIPLAADGSFTSSTPSHTFIPEYQPQSHPRQEAPHVHGIHVHPSGEVFAPDLGNNLIHRLQTSESGFTPTGTIGGFDLGQGPRHSQIHPSGNYLYTLTEMGSQLYVHDLSSAQVINKLSLLPREDADNADMAGAEIILAPPLTPNGPSLLICGNRFSKSDKGDALALFAVSPDGAVTRAPTPFVHGAGRHLRGISTSPDGKYVLVLARDEGGMTMYKRTGEGLVLEQVAKLPQVKLAVVPVWIKDL